MDAATALLVGERYPHMQGLALTCCEGDPAALAAMHDFAVEEGLDVTPFEVGKCYLICTLTLYYIGRVKASTFGFLELDQASWVHNTGRLSQLLTSGQFNSDRARVERCSHGVIVSLSSIVSAYPWAHDLPQRNIP